MPIADTYRTNDGRAYFAFHFVDEGPYWRADIESMPSFGNRDGSKSSSLASAAVFDRGYRLQGLFCRTNRSLFDREGTKILRGMGRSSLGMDQDGSPDQRILIEELAQ